MWRKLEVWWSWKRYAIRSVYKDILYRLNLKMARCAGCGKPTKNGYDTVMRWHVCGECGWTTESLGDSLVEHVLNPNGDWT